MLIGLTLRHIVRRFGGPSFISSLTLITTRVSSIGALGSGKYRRLLEGIANRVFGERLSELLESQMRCAIALMTITRPKKHLFCPFLLALKEEATKRIEGEVDVWSAAEIGDAGLVELHVLAIVQEPDCWCPDLCDFARHSAQMAYFCVDFCGFDNKDTYVIYANPRFIFNLTSYPAIILLQRHNTAYYCSQGRPCNGCATAERVVVQHDTPLLS